jgi:hypothetical protein
MCCAEEKTSYKTAMKWRCWAVALIASGVVGCGIGRVITAPVRYVFKEPEPATNTSDVTNPGQPLAIPSPTVASRKSSRRSRVAANTPPTKPSPSPQPASAAQFPVAKPVPGKPGLVFSPFNASGGYIDVSGYAPGSKVKDPSTQKIFIVP